MTRLRIALLSLAFAGCSQMHAPDDVAAGVYELTIEGALDRCAPARAIGAMGEVAVLATPDGSIEAPVPELDRVDFAAPRVRLSADRSFHAETNRRVAGCPSAWVHEEWTLLDAAAGGFTLVHRQDWQGLAACTEAPAAPVAPASDCTSERTLRYDLMQACRTPCALRLTGESSYACVCE